MHSGRLIIQHGLFGLQVRNGERSTRRTASARGTTRLETRIQHTINKLLCDLNPFLNHWNWWFWLCVSLNPIVFISFSCFPHRSEVRATAAPEIVALQDAAEWCLFKIHSRSSCSLASTRSKLLQLLNVDLQVKEQQYARFMFFPSFGLFVL